MQYGPSARQKSEQPKLLRFLILLYFVLEGWEVVGSRGEGASRKGYENGRELNITELQRQNGRKYKDTLFKSDCTGDTVHGRSQQ